MEREIFLYDGYDEIRTIGGKTVVKLLLTENLSVLVGRKVIDHDVAGEVCAIWNQTKNLTEVDEFLLDKGQCSQEERELIIESMYSFFYGEDNAEDPLSHLKTELLTMSQQIDELVGALIKIRVELACNRVDEAKEITTKYIKLYTKEV